MNTFCTGDKTRRMTDCSLRDQSQKEPITFKQTESVWSSRGAVWRRRFPTSSCWNQWLYQRTGLTQYDVIHRQWFIAAPTKRSPFSRHSLAIWASPCWSQIMWVGLSFHSNHSLQSEVSLLGHTPTTLSRLQENCQMFWMLDMGASRLHPLLLRDLIGQFIKKYQDDVKKCFRARMLIREIE